MEHDRHERIAVPRYPLAVEKAIVVRGRLNGLQRIDLDEPVADMTGEVEVVLRRARSTTEAGKTDVFQVIGSLAAGERSKSDIDRRLAEDRSGWSDL